MNTYFSITFSSYNFTLCEPHQNFQSHLYTVYVNKTVLVKQVKID